MLNGLVSGKATGKKNKSPGQVNCRGAVSMVTALVYYCFCLQGVSEGRDRESGGGERGLERQILCVNYSTVNNSM